jgi:hypothetical protein
MVKKYDFIVSIGRDCACTMYLRNNNMQFKSYPFDWLTNANMKKRFELILNDFKDFLNIEDLMLIPKYSHIPNDNNHNYYESKKSEFYFFHDFPANVELEGSFPEVKAKYDRRIKRFYEQVKNNEKVLFVWLYHGENDLSDEEIISYGSKINEKLNKKIDMFIFETNKSMQADQYNITFLNDNIRKCICNLYSAGFDNITQGNEELGNKIFKENIKLKIGLKQFLNKKIKQKAVKFISAFIPDKQKRKNFRVKFG